MIPPIPIRTISRMSTLRILSKYCLWSMRICPINLPVVDWTFDWQKRLGIYSIYSGICIFCENCVEYCPTNGLSMSSKYELLTYDRHELNYDHIAPGYLQI
nr:NADH dehydrogenase subunit I [Cathaya argyrophylla]